MVMALAAPVSASQAHCLMKTATTRMFVRRFNLGMVDGIEGDNLGSHNLSAPHVALCKPEGGACFLAGIM